MGRAYWAVLFRVGTRDRGIREGVGSEPPSWAVDALGAMRVPHQRPGMGQTTVSRDLSQRQYFSRQSVGLRKNELVRFQHVHEELQVVGTFQASRNLK